VLVIKLSKRYLIVEFLGCIECMRCRLFVIDDRGVCLSVCLSLVSTWLHCAKTAKRIKMLFGVNTLGGLWNIVLHGGF